MKLFKIFPWASVPFQWIFMNLSVKKEFIFSEIGHSLCEKSFQLQTYEPLNRYDTMFAQMHNTQWCLQPKSPYKYKFDFFDALYINRS